MAIFKQLKKRSVKEFKQELARAHVIIALLSIGIIALLSLGATKEVSFDPTLSAISVVLLLVVTILSVCTSISLQRKK